MPTKQQQTLSADYIRDIVVPAILYTRMAQNMQKNNVQFTDAYSPNNIRKIVISPEGTIVYYHVPVNGNLFKIVYYSPTILEQCELMKGYKPIINLIKTPYVCSSIEEIVFVTQGSDGSYLTSSEQWYSGDKNLVDFKRLRDIVVYSGTLQQYISEDKQPFSDKMSMADTTFIHEEDWYKNWGYRPKFYVVDEQLKKRFEKIASQYKTAERDKGKNEKQAERTLTLQKDFDKFYKRYKAIYKCLSKVRKVQEEKGIRNILPSNCDSAFNKAQESLRNGRFYKFSGYEKYKTQIINMEANSDKEALEQNIEIAKACITQLYDGLFEALSNFISYYNKFGEKTVKIAVGSLTKEYHKASTVNWGVSLEECSLPKAVANICADICKLSLREAPDANCIQYYDPTYWKQMLDKTMEG